MLRKHSFLLITILFYSLVAVATDRVSNPGTVNWNTAGTWSPAGVSGAGDNVTITAGTTVVMDGNPSNCLSLTVDGTANRTQSPRTTFASLKKMLTLF